MTRRELQARIVAELRRQTILAQERGEKDVRVPCDVALSIADQLTVKAAQTSDD